MSRFPLIAAALPLAATVLAASFCRADDAATIKLAEELNSNTVTVRALPAAQQQAPADAKAADTKAEPGRPAPAAADRNLQRVAGENQRGGEELEVTVCTGVALGNGRIITHCDVPRGARFRITLPQGGQAEAALLVVDHYSGLRLLRIDNVRLKGIRPTSEVPKVGSTVMTAAAAGLERPTVSVGIVSATERTVGHSGLPPLLQCDLRTTETSSGAAVIDTKGRLVGIVAATDTPDQRNSWAYAVPVSHVDRLLAVSRDGVLVELRRRRPTVGWTLAAGKQKDTVVVEHVVPNGPAARAGIQKGDVVLETENLKIRNAYQAVNLILKKQPGDKVGVTVSNKAGKKNVDLILGGSGPLPAGEPQPGNQRLYAPQVTIFKDGQGIIQNRAQFPLPESDLLRRQLDAYRELIERQQDDLRRRGIEQQQADEKIRRLEQRLKELQPPPPEKNPGS